MAKETKTKTRKGAYTVVLGEERAERIERFRARRHADKGQKISTIDEAVNMLIDAGLQYEALQPTTV